MLLQMHRETLGPIRRQKYELRFQYSNSIKFLLSLADVCSHLINHLQAILPWHLEIKQT